MRTWTWLLFIVAVVAAFQVSAKLAPPVVVNAPTVAAAVDPALEQLRAAKQRGDLAAVLALERPTPQVILPALPDGLTPRAHVPAGAGLDSPAKDRFGGDVLVSGPNAYTGEPALAYGSDGALYAAARSEDHTLIAIFRSTDGGATWQGFHGTYGPLGLGSPAAVVAEGWEDWLLYAYSYGEGTSLAGVWITGYRLDGPGEFYAPVFIRPYQYLGDPRLCVDSPEYQTWYPYVVCNVFHLGRPDDTHLEFTRSLDNGQTWETPQTLASGLTLDDLPDIDFGGTDLLVAYSRAIGDRDICVRISRNFGAAFEPEFVVAGTTAPETEPRIAAAYRGTWACIAYARLYGADRDIMCRFTTDGGATWANAFLPFNGEDEHCPAIVASAPDGRLHAAFQRGGQIQYTWADHPAGPWSEPIVVNDKPTSADAWPAITAGAPICACDPDMNCDGVVDGQDLEPFLLAMDDPAAYQAAYPDCAISQADADCDGDVDTADLDRLFCLIDGLPDCCPAPTVAAGVAWCDDGPPSSIWFDALTLQLPPNLENLIVCADDLVIPAERLARYHRSRGLASSVVQVSDLAPGTPTASQIDSGIETIWAAQPRLRFVTLLGDVSRLPAFALHYAESAEDFFSDLAYGCRGSDYPQSYLPQLAVGRLPAASAAQADTLVDRIRQFEATYGGGDRAIFFGNQMEIDYALTRDAPLATSLGYAATTLVSPDEATLLAALDAPGAALVLYYGHGSAGANWPLRLDNLDLLTNTGRPLLYFSGGCSFNDEHAGVPLGHALLAAPAGSAGSTGAAVAGGYGYDYLFTVGLLEQSRVQKTLGEMVAAALHSHHAAAAAAGQDVGYGSWIYWFTERMRLIGDPALRIDGDVTAAPDVAPAALDLAQNHPNPFNARTTIAFTLPTACFCRLSIFDAAGRRVAVLLDESRAAGRYAVIWDGCDERGRPSSSGVYFYRLEAGRMTAMGRMALVK